MFRTETGFLSFSSSARVVGKLLSRILYLPVIKFWPPFRTVQSSLDEDCKNHGLEVHEIDCGGVLGASR